MLNFPPPWMVEVSKWLLVWPLAKAKRNDFLLQNESISKVSLNNRNCHCDTRVYLKKAFPLNTGKTLPPLISSLILWDLNAKSVEMRLSVSIWVRFRGKILIQCHKIMVRFSFAAWVIKENCYCFYKLWSFEGSHTCVHGLELFATSKISSLIRVECPHEGSFHSCRHTIELTIFDE